MKRIFKIMFSRIGVTALIVVAELSLVLLFMLRLSAYSPYFLMFLIINYFASLLAVVNAEGNPEYKLTWMGVIVLIPFLGTALYAMFGKAKMSKKETKRLEMIRRNLLGDNSYATLGELEEQNSYAYGKARAILSIDRSAGIYCNTEAKYYSTGADMFADMLTDIGRAESRVLLEYFIISDGGMWRALFEVLKKKAEEGVDVCIMYDDVGSMNTLPHKFREMLDRAKIKHVCFSRISADLGNMRRNNSRDHRKLCIIDGSVAYTGGVNIADEYIGKCERFGTWKDGGVRLFGDAATGAERLFLELWMLSGGEKVASDVTPCKVNGDGGYYLPFGSGPYPMYKNQSGKRAILDVINHSQTYVYIMTPYLIIDYDLCEALCGAALRGVTVKIITPGIPDKRMVKVMTKSSYKYLIDGGVEIYEYTPGFIHAKCIVSDDVYAIAGTINMDYRSLVHHFEDAVWMYSSPIALTMRNDFNETLKVSRRIDADGATLTFCEKAVRSLVRLFAPLL